MIAARRMRCGLILITGVMCSVIVMSILVRNCAASWNWETDSVAQIHCFPISVPGTALVIRNLISYEGEFIEDVNGTFETNMVAACLENVGTKGIECARVVLSWPDGAYVFDVEMLPAGMTAVVLEKYKQPYSLHPWSQCGGVQKTAIDNWLDTEIKVIPITQTKIKIQNETDHVLSDTTIYFKNYMQDEDLLLGGVVYSYHAGSLAPGDTIIVEPYYYVQDYSMIVRIDYRKEY